MFGLTPLGALHTLVSLVAIIAGFAALARHGELSTRSASGLVFFWGTVTTCLIGFGIFQHGGFGKPHALGIITLVVMAVALAAELKHAFGKVSRHVATAAYSMTFLFHWIPGITETTTRLPRSQPIFSSPEAFELQVIAGVLFVIYVAGAAWQVWNLKSGGAKVLEDDSTARAR